MTQLGYIFLHRKLLNSDLWRLPPATLKTAVYLVLSCNHKTLPWAETTIERGETFRTIKKMITETSLTAPTLRKALRKLESIGFIKTSNPMGKYRGSLIKVINYHQYQSSTSNLSDDSLPNESPELNSTDKSSSSCAQEKNKKHLNNSGPELEQQAEEIYKRYPRKVGKPYAIKAINKAINKCGFNHIFEKTKLYAKEYNGDHRYIPHPSKFFNQERYNDDPSEWSQNVKNASSQFKPQQISNANFKTGIKEEL